MEQLIVSESKESFKTNTNTPVQLHHTHGCACVRVRVRTHTETHTHTQRRQGGKELKSQLKGPHWEKLEIFEDSIDVRV